MLIQNRYVPEGVVDEAEVQAVGTDGSIDREKRLLVREHRIDIFINEQLVLKLVCTPVNLAELVVGRMITDGFVTDAGEIESLYICEHGTRAKVFLKNDISLHSQPVTEPTCCTSNQVLQENTEKPVKKRLENTVWKKEWIFALTEAFAAGSKIHSRTKGTHSCYLGVEGETVFFAEDIGRHNAMDKAVGYAAINGLDFHRCILFTTGRVPVDMAKKAVMAGIPVLVSKAVPTADAVEMAEKYNLNLICSAWPDRFEVYHTSNGF